MKDIIEQMDEIIRTSSLIARIGSIRNSPFQSYRHLTDDEILRLKSQGNRSTNWDLVLVHPEFATDYIFENSFYGECRLGRFDGKELPLSGQAGHRTGIYRSLVHSSFIGDNCLILETGMVANYRIEGGAVVFRVGELVSSNSPVFGNGRDIAVGRETGGREIASFAEMTLRIAESVLDNTSKPEFMRSYSDSIAKYTAGLALPFGVVDSGAVLKLTPAIRDSFIGSGVHIDGAVLVENCTLLGGPDETTYIGQGAMAKNSCIQWGCRVASMAIVDNSIIMEHSLIERHGKATNVILGPNSSIAEGEATSSFIGPFVGFHHQSMLIAALWPEGRGNIGYGANIGSNHTSRAPDQEVRCGEGLFFGLGTSIKFPANYKNAPYSIIATGIVTAPQRVDFPFSLITKPAHPVRGFSETLNEIVPGWMLAHNLYALFRNEKKYEERNRARRNTFDFRVLRPSTVRKMLRARKVLSEVSPLKEAYTEEDIPGAGKNFITEKNRLQGIETYSFFIRHYALMELKKRLLLGSSSKIGPAFEYSPDAADLEWEFIQKILSNEKLDGAPPGENMRRLIHGLNTVLNGTISSRRKDELRLKSVFDDYEHIDASADRDVFILELRDETQKHIEEIERLLLKL